MLNERYLEIMGERLYKRINDVNTEALEQIGSRIKEIGSMSPSQLHKLKRMKAFGGDVDKIAEKLAKASAKNIEDIYSMFDEVAKNNLEFSEKFYSETNTKYIPYEENKELQRYVKAIADQTVGEYKNLTQNTAFMIYGKSGDVVPSYFPNSNKVPTTLNDTYNRIIDNAVQKAQMGKIDYQSAMRETIIGVADSGIKTVDYASGYSRRLDTAVRQNVLWGLKMCNQKTAEEVGKEFGADGWEIDYHSNPRPSHVEMGGKQYANGSAVTIKGVRYPSIKDVESLLNDYGCLHFKFPIILGVSKPTYSAEELNRLKAQDRLKVNFEGNEYTKYEASQLQRKIETAIRHAKDRQIIARSSGNELLSRQEQAKINVLTHKYDKLCKASGLPTKVERMSVSGYHKIKTIDELKKVDKLGGNGIIKAEAVSTRFVNSNDNLYKNSKNIKPIDGFEDIVIHGNKTGFSYEDSNGNAFSYTVREFADILKNSDVYKGGNIRLISCETGSEGATTAQSLANQLSVNVLAPSDIVWVAENGSMIIGSTPSKNSGKWILFKPER